MHCWERAGWRGVCCETDPTFLTWRRRRVGRPHAVTGHWTWREESKAYSDIPWCTSKYTASVVRKGLRLQPKIIFLINEFIVLSIKCQKIWKNAHQIFPDPSGVYSRCSLFPTSNTNPKMLNLQWYKTVKNRQILYLRSWNQQVSAWLIKVNYLFIDCSPNMTFMVTFRQIKLLCSVADRPVTAQGPLTGLFCIFRLYHAVLFSRLLSCLKLHMFEFNRLRLGLGVYHTVLGCDGVGNSRTSE